MDLPAFWTVSISRVKTEPVAPGLIQPFGSAEHDNIIVIVVSSDAPVSVMMGGIVLETKWQLKPSIFYNVPVLLTQWVTSSETLYY